jgi:hypothetical protein
MMDLDKLRVGEQLHTSTNGRPGRVQVVRVKHTVILIRERSSDGQGILSRRIHRVTLDLIPARTLRA